LFTTTLLIVRSTWSNIVGLLVCNKVMTKLEQNYLDLFDTKS